MRVVIAVVAILIAGVWLLTGTEADAPVSRGVVAEPAATATSPPIPVAAERAALPVATPSSPSADGFAYRVRVVRADDRDLVAGATLRWLPRGFDYGPLSDDERNLQRHDHEAFLIAFGRAMVTDAAGRATLPGHPGSVRLTARAGDWYGEATLRSEALDTECVVTVRRDHALLARAVDTAGRPVPGVQLGLAHDTTLPPRRCLTDADGLVRLPHVQECTTPDRPDEVVVRALLFGDRGDDVAVDLRTLTDRPVDVPVPPFGSLEVLVLGPEGLPWRSPNHEDCTVSVESTRAPRAGLVTAQNSLTLDQQGTARAHPVRCGLEFELRTRGVPSQIVTGPTQPGERVRVELRMPNDTPVLIGRALDAAHRPIAAQLMFRCVGGNGTGEFLLRTRSEGRWQIPLSPGDRDRPLTLTITVMEPGAVQAEQQAHLSLATLPAGITDLGDVQLTATPLLVAGRVQWSDGTPVDRPQVTIDYRDDEGRGWQSLHNTFPSHPGDGRFVFRGAAPGRKLRLHVVGGNYAPRSPVEAVPGAEDVVIEVAKGSTVSARFLIDDATPWRDLHYRLLPATGMDEDDLGLRGAASANRQDDAASCTWRNIAGGQHRLTVTSPGSAAPLVDLSIAVPSGAACEDPRLDGIDLRGRVRGFTVRVTDTFGNAVTDERAGVLFSGFDDPQAVRYARGLDHEGRARLTATAPVDLVVFAPGLRQHSLSSVFADTQVILEPGLEVRVRLMLPVALPAATVVTMHCAPQRASDARSPRCLLVNAGSVGSSNVDDLLGGTSNVEFGADRIATVQMIRPEAYALSVALHRSSGRGASAALRVQPATLDPRALRDGQVIELRVEETEMHRAIEALGKE